LGTHEGAAGFTIGQRKGLGVATGEPRYVSRIDPATNAIVFGRREDLETSVIPLDSVSFIAGTPPSPRDADGTWRSFRAQVRIRHRADLVDGVVRPAAAHEAGMGDRWVVETARPVWAIAPGQACVLYDGDVCLGGGRIATPGEPTVAAAAVPGANVGLAAVTG
jgi:tRNA-specific 2-thiouridylase